jgi:YidC/Oxa1 family membrane protein insertase
MTNPNIFNQFLVWPIINLLLFLYKIFESVHFPGALGLAVIALTVLVRLILYPLTVAQLKSAYKLNKLKPQMDELNKKFKDDKNQLHLEQLKLYQQAGINPAAGCLPLLLQFPILIALYNVFFQILSGQNIQKVIADINKIVYSPFLKVDRLDLSFLGLNLARKPSEWQSSGWWLLFVPVITAALQYWQTKLMTPQNIPLESKASSLAPTRNVSTGQAPKKKEEDMATAMQKQMAVMMPLMIGFFSYSFPLGLSLYWNTFGLFGIIQQYQLNKQMKKENG